MVFDDSAGYCDDLTETMVVNLTNRNAVTFDLAPPPCVKLIELEPTLTTELLKVCGSRGGRGVPLFDGGG